VASSCTAQGSRRSSMRWLDTDAVANRRPSTRKRKGVSFELAQTQYFGGMYYSTLDELKSKWYTEQELQESREEARMCVEALIAVGGKLDHVNTAQLCLRGIEKFANVTAKARARRLLMTSILGQQQQRKRRCTAPHSTDPTTGTTTTITTTTTVESSADDQEELAALSRYLSQPSRELAHSFGLLNASKVHHFHSTQMDPQQQQKESSFSSLSEARQHERLENDAARALLCMSPAASTSPSTNHSPASSSSLDGSDDNLRPSPSKRARVLLIEEAASLTRHVNVNQ
jgi:hypothetical protein